MNEKRQMLLYKAAKNDGVLSVNMAENLYSSRESAKSALASLEFQDYIEKSDVPGNFKIVKLPASVKHKLGEK